MKQLWFESDSKVLNSHHMAVALIDLAKNRGADREKLLRGTGIFYQDLQHRDFPISATQLYRLITNIEKYSQSRDISFLAGRRFFPGNLDSVGQLLMNARSLQDMLRIVLRFQSLLFPLMYCRVEKHQQHTYLLFNPSVNQSKENKFLLELLFTAINASCKWRLGKSLPLHFYFRHARPRNIYQYEENLGSRLTFDQHLDMVRIDNHWLQHQFVDASPLLRAQNLDSCVEQLQGAVTPQLGLLQYVSQLLSRQRVNNLESAACELGMSSATFKRKLKQHGTSFQQLYDNIRCQQAVFELQIRGASNQVTAEKLNFSDLPNFRRSLKRWTGLTPSDLRQA